MAISWDDVKLNWIVPARRVVVRRRIGFADAAEAWAAQLDHYRDQIRRWYGGGGTGAGFKLDEALRALRDWIEQSVRERAVATARDKPATIDLGEERFHPRLWKGPLRVVHEAAGTPMDGAPQLDDQKAVTNPDAVFRAGDVLEFPLHKVLAKCGRAEYGALEFDPNGSFLLGTSVKGGSRDGTLHDNAAAMRLQLLVCLGKGAFYSDKPTFSKTVSEPPMPAGKDDGLAVYARGMPYSGTLVSPGSHDKGWKIQNYHWGMLDKHGSACLPMFRPKLSPQFPEDQPLTPGWVCSPFTLFVSQYIVGARGGKRSSNRLIFDGGVRTSYTEHKNAKLPLHRHYEYLPWKTFVKDPTLQAQVAETTHSVDELREGLQQAVANLSGARRLAESGLREDLRDLLLKHAAGKKAAPEKLSRAVADLLKEAPDGRHAVDDAQKWLLRTFHRLWMADVLVFSTNDRVEAARAAIRGHAGWKSLGKRPPKLATQGWPKSCPDATCERDHAGMKNVTPVLKELTQQVAALPASGEEGEEVPGFDGRSALHADFSGALGDVNVAVLNGHEIAILKVWPFEHLANEHSLPRSAGLAGYHPLTGEPFTTPKAVPAAGQLYLMESTGTYKTWKVSKKGKRDTFQVLPWRATVIDNNRMILSFSNRTAQVRVLKQKRTKQVWIGEYREGKAALRGRKPLDAMVRMLPAGGDELVGRAFLRSNAYADLPWPKIYHILMKGKQKEKSPPATDEWYAERAVPFATLSDVADGYPTVAEAHALADKLAAEAYAEAEAKPKGSSVTTWAWAWYVSEMKNPNPAKPKPEAGAGAGASPSAQPPDAAPANPAAPPDPAAPADPASPPP